MTTKTIQKGTCRIPSIYQSNKSRFDLLVILRSSSCYYYNILDINQSSVQLSPFFCILSLNKSQTIPSHSISTAEGVTLCLAVRQQSVFYLDSTMTVGTNKEMLSSRTGKLHSITTTDQLTLFPDVIQSKNCPR